MCKTFKVRVYDIDYCLEDEEDSEEYYEAINKRIAQIKSELPQDMIFTIECEKEDLEDMACDAISEETGWLVNSFSYDIL